MNFSFSFDFDCRLGFDLLLAFDVDYYFFFLQGFDFLLAFYSLESLLLLLSASPISSDSSSFHTMWLLPILLAFVFLDCHLIGYPTTDALYQIFIIYFTLNTPYSKLNVTTFPSTIDPFTIYLLYTFFLAVPKNATFNLKYPSEM